MNDKEIEWLNGNLESWAGVIVFTLCRESTEQLGYCTSSTYERVSVVIYSRDKVAYIGNRMEKFSKWRVSGSGPKLVSYSSDANRQDPSTGIQVGLPPSPKGLTQI